MSDSAPETGNDAGRLERQLGFILEIDKLKSVLRQTRLVDESRRENDAEHSWEVAMMAIVLAEHAGAPIDLARVVRMLLIHDIVEIDAGDTFIYDDAARKTQAEREERAAERLFGLLPDDQAVELRELWTEFEDLKTAESRFAKALDRLQPLLHNYHSGGALWSEHGLDHGRVTKAKRDHRSRLANALGLRPRSPEARGRRGAAAGVSETGEFRSYSRETATAQLLGVHKHEPSRRLSDR